MKCYCDCGWPILLAYRPSGATQEPIYFDRSQHTITRPIDRCPGCGAMLSADALECCPPNLRAVPAVWHGASQGLRDTAASA